MRPSCETPCNDNGNNCEKCHRNGECISEASTTTKIEPIITEIIQTTDDINICLSLINIGTSEINNDNLSSEKILNEEIQVKCKDFF